MRVAIPTSGQHVSIIIDIHAGTFAFAIVPEAHPIVLVLPNKDTESFSFSINCFTDVIGAICIRDAFKLETVPIATCRIILSGLSILKCAKVLHFALRIIYGTLTIGNSTIAIVAYIDLSIVLTGIHTFIYATNVQAIAVALTVIPLSKIHGAAALPLVGSKILTVIVVQTAFIGVSTECA